MKFSSWTLLPLLGLALASPVPDPLSNTESELARRNTPLNNFLTALLDFLPAIDGTLESVAGILTAFETVLAKDTGAQTTSNVLGGPCTNYTVIFARGTTEPGNIGILVGPAFLEALKQAVGSSALTFQGVNGYSASIKGYLQGGDPVGSAAMANQIKAAYAQCPSTKLVISGYSQGGQLVHNAAKLLPTAVANWISKVVIFGDPDSATNVTGVSAAKTLIYCHAGDNICVNGDLILPAHLTYAINAQTAAAFAVGR